MININESSFSHKQIEFLKTSNSRINLATGSVRSGKTIATIFKWIHYIKYGPKGPLLMVGKTERTLKRNILDPMQSILGRSFTYNKGTGEIYVNNRLIYICGANDERAEEKIRGLTLAGAYGDEVTLWPESFFSMLLSRMSISNAQFFGTTNTDSPYHWLKEKYIDNSELDLVNVEFSIDDNCFLDTDYVNNLKKEYSGLYYSRFIDGLWVLADGVIYDSWDPNVHTLNFLPTLNKHIVGIDYGTSNVCTFLLFGFNNIDKIYLEKEYYYNAKVSGKQKTDDEYVIDFERFIGEVKPLSIYIDPSASSFKTAMRRKDKWNIKHDVNNDVLDGIAFISGLLKNKRLLVNNKCINFKKEVSSYSWDSKAQQKGEDKPIKKYDHTMDATRYALYNHFGQISIQGKVNFSMNKIFGGSKNRRAL